MRYTRYTRYMRCMRYMRYMRYSPSDYSVSSRRHALTTLTRGAAGGFHGVLGPHGRVGALVGPDGWLTRFEHGVHRAARWHRLDPRGHDRPAQVPLHAHAPRSRSTPTLAQERPSITVIT